MSGTTLNKRIMLAVSAILFRNNRGKGWFGTGVKMHDGSVVIPNPRYLEFGLINGASDLIGWTERVITPDMIGMKVAVFTGIEGKFGDDEPSSDQETFVRNVRRAGGIAGFARSPKEAQAVIDGWPYKENR